MKNIQVSTTAPKREQYKSHITENSSVVKEWIPRKHEIEFITKFENDCPIIKGGDYYDAVVKTYNHNGEFINGKNKVAVFVVCVGGSGYGSDTKGFLGAQACAWSDPVGGWQIKTNKTHGIGKGVNYKFEAHNKSATENRYVHNPNPALMASPSSFGRYLSANAGLNIEENTCTNRQIKRQWYCTGWDGWWATGSRYERAYWAYETQNVKTSIGAYDVDLLGSDGEIRFGIFTLKPFEVVPISVGTGAVNGYVNIVYFALHNSKGEIIQNPTSNDVTDGIILPKPIPPKPPTTQERLRIAISPNPISLEVGQTLTLTIQSNAPTLSYELDNANVSFDETTKELRGNIEGSAILSITATRDTESIKRAVAITITQAQNQGQGNTQNQGNNQGQNQGQTGQGNGQTNQNTQNPQQLIKLANGYPLYDKLDSMNREELSYLYTFSLLWQQAFQIATQNNMPILIPKTIPQDKIQEVQTIYTDLANGTTPQTMETLKHYAKVGIDTLINHIAYYPFIQGFDPFHKNLLESLIEEHAHRENGQDFSHRFTQAVITMPKEDFLDSMTLWITELDGLLVRDKNQGTQQGNTNHGTQDNTNQGQGNTQGNTQGTTNTQTNLDSNNVAFSKNPNSYIARQEVNNTLYVELFTFTWDDPSETDYLHELFWFVMYDSIKVPQTMPQVKQTWLAQKTNGGDSNVSNTPEKRQKSLNGEMKGVNNSGNNGLLAHIFREAFYTDMKDVLFEPFTQNGMTYKLKDSIYQLPKHEFIALFTQACQKVYAITKP